MTDEELDRELKGVVDRTVILLYRTLKGGQVTFPVACAAVAKLLYGLSTSIPAMSRSTFLEISGAMWDWEILHREAQALFKRADAQMGEILEAMDLEGKRAN